MRKVRVQKLEEADQNQLRLVVSVVDQGKIKIHQPTRRYYNRKGSYDQWNKIHNVPKALPA